MTAKIETWHLERRAYVYVRQSTAMQVFENTESTARQYALAERARALGWSEHDVEVIDDDLGRSGATTEHRSGFHRLAEAVAHGHAGAILAIEVSRLARSSQDWQRLLAVCAVAQVVIIDEHAVYDPQHCDDKLLLDFKGTMSEAELHWLSLRLVGARRSKARRGELRKPLPTGYVWSDRGIEMDRDEAVRQAISTVFERFAIEPSAGAVVRWARRTGFQIPTRRYFAGGTSELSWHELGRSRLGDMLRNPTYAGCYTHGRRPEKKVLIDGEIRTIRPPTSPDEWAIRIEDAHAGYITWQTFTKNLKKLEDNSALMYPATPGPLRKGRALLAGLVVCGRCGRRMRPTYWGHGEVERFSYTCLGERDSGSSSCWSVKGPPIDVAVEALFLDTVAPDELELCLAVEREVDAQAASLDEQWRLRLEKASYEARCAERRYKAVDPDNRVVARTLEHDWEMALRECEEVRSRYEAAKREQLVQLSDADRARIRELVGDLPNVWRAPTTMPEERKAMLREVIEAVVLHPIDVPERQTLIRVQWKSGTIDELRTPRPDRGETQKTSSKTVARVRELAAQGLRDEAIARQLNAEGSVTGAGAEWNETAVKWARRRNDIARTAPDRPRTKRLPDRRSDGRYSVSGVTKRFDVSSNVVRGWIQRGLVDASCEEFERYPRSWWIRIDSEAEPRLEAEAVRARARSEMLRRPLAGGGPAS